MRILGLGAAVLAMSMAGPAIAADMEKEKQPGGAQQSSQQQPSQGTQQDAGQAATSSEAKSEGKKAGDSSTSAKSTDKASGTDPGTDMSESSSTSGAATGGDQGMAADAGEKMSGEKKSGEIAEGKDVGKDVNETMNMAGSEGKELIGKQLIGADDQEVGEVKDVLMTDEGMLQAVLVDVGGFLGIGAKTVAIPADKIQIQGNNVIARDLTKESAENMKAYKAKQG